MAGENQTIIIKKIKKGGEGHHGGAWKVAYADFVTAMMAFFLLLWLLNVTTDVQKRGIADYFAPASISREASGSGAPFGGQTMISVASKIADGGVAAVVDGNNTPADVQTPDNDDNANNKPPGGTRNLTDSEIEKKFIQQEQQRFTETEKAINQAIQQTPEVADLARNLIMDVTPEGLRIQLVDQEKASMFPSGSASMNEKARALMGLIAKVVAKVPNKVSVSGHTDAQPYRTNNGYGNWELSADRANASRRALVESGVPAERFRYVSGKADQEPLIASDPLNASNRRISIVLLRDTPLPVTAGGPTASGGAVTAPTNNRAPAGPALPRLPGPGTGRAG